jgi:hypothetical protein
VRRAADRHPHDYVEIHLGVRLLRTDEVSDMRRVEGAAEEADPQAGSYSFICPSPRAIHLNEQSSRVPIGPRA